MLFADVTRSSWQQHRANKGISSLLKSNYLDCILLFVPSPKCLFLIVTSRWLRLAEGGNVLCALLKSQTFQTLWTCRDSVSGKKFSSHTVDLCAWNHWLHLFIILFYNLSVGVRSSRLQPNIFCERLTSPIWENKHHSSKGCESKVIHSLPVQHPAHEILTCTVWIWFDCWLFTICRCFYDC